MCVWVVSWLITSKAKTKIFWSLHSACPFQKNFEACLNWIFWQFWQVCTVLCTLHSFKKLNEKMKNIAQKQNRSWNIFWIFIRKEKEKKTKTKTQVLLQRHGYQFKCVFYLHIINTWSTIFSVKSVEKIVLVVENNIARGITSHFLLLRCIAQWAKVQKKISILFHLFFLNVAAAK